MSETAGRPIKTSANGAAAIETNDLTKRFGTHVAVDRLSFSVPKGSIFGFLGPNGAGKTTTIGMLLGLIPPDGGSARVLGFDTRSQLDQVLQRTGALVERPAFYPFLSGRRNLLHFARQLGIDDPTRVDETLDAVGMTERADAKFGGYSTGMKQRIGIACALLSRPELVVLDEPTSGLDPAGQREIRTLVRELASEGRTVFLSSHILPEIQEVCTHVAIIDHGRLVSSGPLADILTGGDQIEIEVDRVEEARIHIGRLQGVGGVTVADGRLLVDAPLEISADLNSSLVQAGFRVSQLRRRESRLEERFLALTEQDGVMSDG
jgi:ABC-type multidrug transport system ATPase subunit